MVSQQFGIESFSTTIGYTIMSTISGAEAMVRMLQHHGVEHIFGLCGDTSLPFYDALHQLDHGITHVLTRDERSAIAT